MKYLQYFGGLSSKNFLIESNEFVRPYQTDTVEGVMEFLRTKYAEPFEGDDVFESLSDDFFQIFKVFEKNLDTRTVVRFGNPDVNTVLRPGEEVFVYNYTVFQETLVKSENSKKTFFDFYFLEEVVNDRPNDDDKLIGRAILEMRPPSKSEKFFLGKKINIKGSIYLGLGHHNEGKSENIQFGLFLINPIGEIIEKENGYIIHFDRKILSKSINYVFKHMGIIKN